MNHTNKNLILGLHLLNQNTLQVLCVQTINHLIFNLKKCIFLEVYNKNNFYKYKMIIWILVYNSNKR